jgi:hypothetical protein
LSQRREIVIGEKTPTKEDDKTDKTFDFFAVAAAAPEDTA